MYSFSWKRVGPLPEGRWPRLSANVVSLGLTSMLTDISAEMVASILPVYLVIAVGLSPLQFGFVDGVSRGIAVIAQLLGGVAADRWQRHRSAAAWGYGLSALCRLLMLPVGGAWALISSVLILDRIGKGLRTAPRDSLLSLSGPPEHLGFIFGVHRALDTMGALLGPIVAFALLAMLPAAYDVVFVTSFCFATLGLAMLLCFVKEVPGGRLRGPAGRQVLSDMRRLVGDRSFVVVLLMGSLFALCTVADSFLLLTIQRKAEVDIAYFPLLYVVPALAYLVLAVPVGRVADRFGRDRIFLLGHAALLLGLVSLLAARSDFILGMISLVLLGVYYACTDGVLVAFASRFIPTDIRSTGLAVVGSATGIARIFASVIFGAVWNWTSVETALAVFATGLTAILLTGGPFLLREIRLQRVKVQ